MKKTSYKTASSQHNYTIGRESSSGVWGFTAPPVSAKKAADKSDNKIEKAVYSHVQAMRALGRQSVSTVEIAKALSLPRSRVEQSVEVLKSKGVRVLK